MHQTRLTYQPLSNGGLSAATPRCEEDILLGSEEKVSDLIDDVCDVVYKLVRSTSGWQAHLVGLGRFLILNDCGGSVSL